MVFQYFAHLLCINRWTILDFKAMLYWCWYILNFKGHFLAIRKRFQLAVQSQATRFKLDMASLIYGTCTSPWIWIYIQAICADNGNSIYSKKEKDRAEICWNNQWLCNNIKELNRFVSMSVRNELPLWQEIKVKAISLGKSTMQNKKH